MKPKAKWLQDSSPGPEYVRRNLDRVTITRATFEPGMWQETWFPQSPGGYKSFDSVHVQTRGHMEELGGLMPVRKPGWTSSDCAIPIPEGTHRRVAVDQVELWCCRAILDKGSADHVGVVTLDQGQDLDLPVGTRLMLLSGELQMAGSRFRAPHLISVRSIGVRLEAVFDSIAFMWKYRHPWHKTT